MSEIRENLVYSDDHEWALKVEGNVVRVGISDHAQCQLGDIVFVELPEAGAAVSAGDSIGTIESVKTVSELYSPVSGTITKVNNSLEDQPELVNGEPYDGGWIIEVEVEGELEEALGKLLTAESYRAKVD
ncbi:glycine cleavage system H protein [Paenibacillus vortex V453]|uniref:Glycine cleavage system H protein n=2 Tax=Paenibacillus TaxID=44249 RepID=A0A163M235_9BACL|nr:MULTISPECIES: glycine cleavage system protein GcvH [Paenibacillus]MDL0547143.1 glycine cleavage system protein GcvH [Yersinia pestis]AWP27835.1 glycine cleavage system protein H [Paenibacillus sp. Cedars]EFU40376.1 glycine cleavage system H protein [Paenibacillus vortex V453]KZS48676.1 glycine cleavage system protein H [Paenibacillus glucanolyticus]MDH6675596.1 glycine cleavage system H protein [Paenibacillus sp. LBL]